MTTRFIIEHRDVLEPDTGSTTRRTFLRLALVTPVAAVIGCSSSSSSPASFGDVSAGNVSALPVGTVKTIQGATACIARDAQGVYAMTLTCTHEGCDMSQQGSVSAQAIRCNCHNSVFDMDGNVVSGPANSPLQHFSVTVDAEGNLTAHGGTPVSSTTRLAVT